MAGKVRCRPLAGGLSSSSEPFHRLLEAPIFSREFTRRMRLELRGTHVTDLALRVTLQLICHAHSHTGQSVQAESRLGTKRKRSLGHLDVSHTSVTLILKGVGLDSAVVERLIFLGFKRNREEPLLNDSCFILKNNFFVYVNFKSGNDDPIYETTKETQR